MHSVSISRNSWEPIRLKKYFKVRFQGRHHLDCTISTYIAYTMNFIRPHIEEYVLQKERFLTWILCSFWERSSCVCRASCSSLSLRAPNVYIHMLIIVSINMPQGFQLRVTNYPKDKQSQNKKKLQQQVCKRNMQYI